MFSKETYISRRSALKKSIGSGLLLFIGNDEAGCNYAGNTYPYRQDSTFLYFFGQPYAGLSAIIDIDDDREIIFGDELTIDDIIWMGIQPTLQEKCSSAGIMELMPANTIMDYMKKAQQKGQAVHYLPSYRPEHKLKLWSWLGVLPGEEKSSIDLIKAVVNLRNYKSEEEIAEIEKACFVTAEMHLAAMRTIRPGIHEYEVVAAIEAVTSSHNCGLSFPIIATKNGQTLHNHYHGNPVRSGDLFLVDAGAETEMGYAGDMSSTTPADHQFTAKQRDVYMIQTAMHDKSVAALRPGITFEEVYDLSAQVMVDGLKELGLMKGDAVEAVKKGAHALFYPHGLGHMMGLDVHDMENLGEVYVGYDGRPKSKQFGRASLRLGRTLECGFVHTIEPGIYFIPELIDQWKAENKFAGFINYDKIETYKDFGGIRNEEDYLITETGARLLGKRIPRTVEEIEAFRD
ncbi:MAG: aminopeptidase P family protein [Tannerella sp.]|jgi:Xaa-Pro aminopeptidase|nr:aminopeptidase P family protein [Tannerella sp.]